MTHEVTLITGDGTGPELAEAARKCVDATGVAIDWDVQEAGVDVMERTGTPLPDSVLDSVRRTKCALKAPITTPVGHRISQYQCVSPPGAGAVRLYSALQVLSWRAELLQRARRRPGDRAREHGGSLCGR